MLFFLICASFAIFPEMVIAGAKTGLELCLGTVIPSLLPFMVVSSCLIKSRFSVTLGNILSKVITPLTGISSAGCVCFVTGLVGGYGAGARAVSDSYRENLISKAEAESLLPFCNNAGPLFVIGTVGTGFYFSKSIGVMLLAVQVFSAVICARIFSGNYHNPSVEKQEKNKLSFGELVTKSAIESGGGIINACVFVISFCALIEVLPFGKFGFLGGILEVTRGCSEMAIRGGDSLPIVSAFLAWGGLSVHLQANALCSGKLNMKKYYAGKFITSAVAYMLVKITAGDLNVLALIAVVYAAVMLVWSVIRTLFFREQLPQSLFRQRRHS